MQVLCNYKFYGCPAYITYTSPKDTNPTSFFEFLSNTRSWYVHFIYLHCYKRLARLTQAAFSSCLSTSTENPAADFTHCEYSLAECLMHPEW